MGRHQETSPVNAGTWEQNLASAIVLQAATDYMRALKTRNYATITECERFFRSEWFTMLSDLDPEYLMRKAQETVLRGKRKKRILAVNTANKW